MNYCVFSGYLGDKPELKTSAAGKSVCEFRLSIPRDYKSADGERKSDFITVVAWGKSAETISACCEKGTKLNMLTHVRTEQYTDKNGIKRESHKYEIDRFEFAERKGLSAGTSDSGAKSNVPEHEVESAPKYEELGADEELPF